MISAPIVPRKHSQVNRKRGRTARPLTGVPLWGESFTQTVSAFRRAIRRRQGEPGTAPESKKPRQYLYCRSRFSASKAAAPPYLQSPAPSELSSYPDSALPRSPHRLLRKIPNDRLSPCAAASTLTVAVPFGIRTRFPILSRRPTGPRSTKLTVYFRS